MTHVIVKEADYRYERLQPLVAEMMDRLGAGRMKDCRRVLLKPNLLTIAQPEDAVLTHSQVVRAVAEYVLDQGAIPLIADSPAFGSFHKILRESGIKDALKGLPVEFRKFSASLPVDVGEPFGVIDLARDALEAEMTINLPKLKTHGQMLLSLGVKNMFGCVVGLRKAEWHMKMGMNREMFARLIAGICHRLQPAITLLDGVLALEGEGPGKRGRPRKLGILMAGRDPFAVDAAVCRMLGLTPDMLPTLKAAKDLGIFQELPDIEGALPEIGDFLLPTMAEPLPVPRLLQGFLRRRLLQRPVCDQNLCRLCGICQEFCPAGAIREEGRAISFNYDGCIRCYCCSEVCPQGAVHARQPLAGRIFGSIIGRRKA